MRATRFKIVDSNDFHALALKVLRSEISSGERMREMELVGQVCLYVCSSIRHLEHERVARLGRVSILSMRRKGGKTMAPVTDRSVARGTCHMRSRKTSQKISSQGCRPNQWTDTSRTLLANGHRKWASAIVVAGDKRNKRHVQEENLFKRGIL